MIINRFSILNYKLNELADQLARYKEANNNKDIEIKRLKSQLNNSTDNLQPPQQRQQEQSTQQPNKNEGWNKEVRILDARINDVLGKIKERELFLNNYDDWERKCKDCEKKYENTCLELDKAKDQLVNTNGKLNDLKIENDELKMRLKRMASEQLDVKQMTSNARKLSLHDFQDDLGKCVVNVCCAVRGG